MKLRSFYCISFTGFLLLTQALCSKDTQKGFENQYIAQTGSPALYDIFFRPIDFNRTSIKNFITRSYNHPAYAHNFLALNFSHIGTFLSYADQSIQPRSYAKSIFKLFGQKLKATPYVNAYALLELVQQLPALVKPLASPEAEKAAKQEEIKRCLYNFLLKNFKKLKENPDDALEQLSSNLYDISTSKNTKDDQDISVYELQKAIEQFLEIALNKVIWSPYDQQDIWLSAKEFSYKLEELLTVNGLAGTQELEELYWSLIHRFCYLLATSGSELTQDTYAAVQQDLAHEQLLLLSLKEQESFITSKREHVEQAVMAAQVTAAACQSGLILGSS